uniref:type IV pilus biogenesis protein PilM n=1 Tax=Thaumasiovibrio occultus TaxID=1891184 RepID=UPI000B34C471|nr:type IV pilus assembly protein PilM [Thaumasiovibrio occultus]
MFQNPISIGLDIGNHSIKMVVVELRRKKPFLLACHERVLASPIINDQHSVDEGALLSELRQIRKVLPSKARKVSMALPDSAVISKVVHLDPSLSDRELHFAVRQALATSSPFPVDELQIDYFAVDKGDAAGASSASTVAFQVYACRKQVLVGRHNALKKAKLQADILELKSHALVWLGEIQKDALPAQQNWAVLDIGMRQSDFCVGVSPSQFYRREIPIAATQVAMYNPGFDWDHPDPQACETFTNNLAEQLKRQIQLYNSTHPKAPLAGIWLSGGGDRLIDADQLSSEINLPVQWADPIPLLGGKRKAGKDKILSSRFGLAVGLAVRGVN